MSNFNLGDSTAFGDGKSDGTDNHGVKFWGHDLFKFDGSEKDKVILLKTISKYITIVTEKTIPVKFSRYDSDESYTDGKSITISSLILPNSLDSTVGLGLHEACHIVLTDFTVLHDLMECKNIPVKHLNHIPFIKNIWNWVEDRRIDKWALSKAPGFEKYYTSLYNRYFFSEKITELLNNKSKKLTESVENYLFYIINSMHENVLMNELKGLPEIKDLIDIENIERFTNSDETLKCAVKIMGVILKYITEPIRKPKDRSKLNKSNTSQTGDDNELKDLIDEILEGQESFLDGNPIIGGKEIKVPLDSSTADYLERLSCSGTTKVSVKISKNKSADIQSIEVFVVDKVDLNTIKSNLYDIFVLNPDTEKDGLINRGFSLGTMLGRKLKITDEIRTQRTIKLKTGKIDKRNLHSAGFGSENLFYTLKENKKNDVGIHITVDSSGSMDSGGKWDKTLVAIVAICKAASTVGGIRVQLSFRYLQYIYDLKAKVINLKAIVINFYDSKYDKINKLRLLNSVIPAGGTPEGICFDALQRGVMLPLMNNKTLFINFSDGEPSIKEAIKITKNIINKFKERGLFVLSYFITHGEIQESMKSKFIDMYGKSAEFIDVNSLINLATTINKYILKMSNK